MPDYVRGEVYLKSETSKILIWSTRELLTFQEVLMLFWVSYMIFLMFILFFNTVLIILRLCTKHAPFWFEVQFSPYMPNTCNQNLQRIQNYLFKWLFIQATTISTLIILMQSEHFCTRFFLKVNILALFKC